MTGFALAMYLAGLRGIPDDIREAARMDGCTEFQLYRKNYYPIIEADYGQCHYYDGPYLTENF